MDSRNLDYLVTGGNGYIGSHMCKFLVSKGLKVGFIDNCSTSPKNPVHQYGSFFEIDLLNQSSLMDVVKEIKPKYLFHFAGSALVGESETDPVKYYRNNFTATLNLVEAFMKYGGRKMIFSSTCATYGVPANQEKISEDHSQNPINAYGNSKFLIEQMLEDLSRLDLLDTVFLRYFNVAGNHPEGDIGENHDPETHLIPNLIQSYLSESNREEFFINGENHATDDGTCVRDYIHVEDLVRAHFAALDYIKSRKGNQAFNLGSGRGYSVREVLQIFENIVETKLKTTIVKARPGDPPYLVADNKKAKNELNFVPEYKLEDCIKHSLNFFKKRSE